MSRSCIPILLSLLLIKFCIQKILLLCNISTWILIIWLLYQARPTLYQVVKDMIDKMGYEVWLFVFGLLICLSLLFLNVLWCFHQALMMMSNDIIYCIMQVRAVRVTKRVQEAYFAQLYLSKALSNSSLYHFFSSTLPPPQNKPKKKKWTKARNIYLEVLYDSMTYIWFRLETSQNVWALIFDLLMLSTLQWDAR